MNIVLQWNKFIAEEDKDAAASNSGRNFIKTAALAAIRLYDRPMPCIVGGSLASKLT